MHRTVSLLQDETTVDASITIRRSVGEVFSFYRNFENLPRFLGDVMAIEQISSKRSCWTIQGPLGRRGAAAVCRGEAHLLEEGE
jgi:uncharacterized membrane protein